MYKYILAMLTAGVPALLAAPAPVPAHFSPRAAELLADRIELEESAYQLNVVYFVGNDYEPTADYERRISELLVYLQQYYGKEMDRNGFGKRSFGLSMLPNGNVNILLIRGKEKHTEYSYDRGPGKILKEIEAWYKEHPEQKRSQHSFVLMPTFQNEQYSDKSPGGVPFYGYGRDCFALDYKEFDIRHLGQDTEWGRLLTKWYGGFAHELGHGLNLPHVGGTKTLDKERGTALMKNGNYTFGYSPTYLTPTSCHILSCCEVFSTEKKPHYAEEEPVPAVHSIKFRVAQSGKELKLMVDTDASVSQVIALVQDPPYSVNQDYDAIGFPAEMTKTKDGLSRAKITIPFSEITALNNLGKGEMGIDLLFQKPDGTRYRWTIPFDGTKLEAGTKIPTPQPQLDSGY